MDVFSEIFGQTTEDVLTDLKTDLRVECHIELISNLTVFCLVQQGAPVDELSHLIDQLRESYCRSTKERILSEVKDPLASGEMTKALENVSKEVAEILQEKARFFSELAIQPKE